MSVALFILAAGIGYAIARSPTYGSTGRLVLVPVPADERDLPQLLDSVGSSGTLGTYVELIQSPETLRQAWSSGFDVEVRAVPDTRVITVTVRGTDETVRPAADAIMGAARREALRLGDPWRIAVLDRASAPSQAAPTRPTIIIATLALALLGGIFVAVLLTRLSGPRVAAPVGRPEAVPDEEPDIQAPSQRPRAESSIR